RSQIMRFSLRLGTWDRRLLAAGRVEKVVQRCILPGDAVLLGELLEPAQVLLGDLVARFLIRWVAIEDTTAQGSWLPGRTQVVLLERAEVGRDWLFVRRGGGQQDVGFEIAQEEDVAIFLEAAAAAAGHAHGTRGGNGLIDFPIDFQDLAAEFI